MDDVAGIICQALAAGADGVKDAIGGRRLLATRRLLTARRLLRSGTGIATDTDAGNNTAVVEVRDGRVGAPSGEWPEGMLGLWAQTVVKSNVSNTAQDAKVESGVHSVMNFIVQGKESLARMLAYCSNDDDSSRIRI